MRKPLAPREMNKPEHWRKRAQETRAMAEGEPAEVRAKLLEIAAAYDQLADRAEPHRKH
jgi:hypothetical protein